MYISKSARIDPISYLFIDGASFQSALNELFGLFFLGEEQEVHWGNLRGMHKKVFYYDAIPVQLPDEDIDRYLGRVNPKQVELAKIERQPGYHVRTGDAHKRRNRGHEQKMVDVQLAVDALLAASRGLFTHCALFTGDLDFRPLIAALVEMGVDVTLHYPLGHTSNELLAAADNVVPITIVEAEQYLILSEIQKAGLPRAYSDNQTKEAPPEGAIAVWEDSDYGICFVAKNDERLQLVTERCPYNPKTHRFVLNANTMEHLRYYAEKVRGLSIPQEIQFAQPS